MRNALLIGLLAAACVCVCELVACHIADPPLYHAVADPVKDSVREVCRHAGELSAQAAEGLVSFSRQASDGLVQFSSRLEEQVRRANAHRWQRAALFPEAEAEPDTVIPEPSVPLAPAPPALSLVCEGDEELLLGGKVPLVYYCQSDPAWARQLFGRDPIGGYGCGPTAMAMAVSTLTGETVDPARMAALSARLGYCSPGCGSSLSIVSGVAAHYGLDCVSLPPGDPGALADALSGSGMVVALMGPGQFTAGGHFIILHSLTPEGRVLIADPNSRIHTLASWDLSFLEEQLSAGRGAGAPLWRLTAPPE